MSKPDRAGRPVRQSRRNPPGMRLFLSGSTGSMYCSLSYAPAIVFLPVAPRLRRPFVSPSVPFSHTRSRIRRFFYDADIRPIRHFALLRRRPSAGIVPILSLLSRTTRILIRTICPFCRIQVIALFIMRIYYAVRKSSFTACNKSTFSPSVLISFLWRKRIE